VFRDGLITWLKRLIPLQFDLTGIRFAHSCVQIGYHHTELTNMKKLLGLVAAIGMSCLAPAIASASIINFGFETNGTVSTASCGSNCVEVKTSGTVSELTDNVPNTSTWTLSGSMKLSNFWQYDSSWSFLDDNGNNNLSGTFAWVPDADGVNGYYKVTGGTGLFAGATGNGSSVISITNWFSGLPEFYEVGWMTVKTPGTNVAEPSTTGLAFAGLLMLGFAAFQRRRANVTRG
jgi:hypothetical protein